MTCILWTVWSAWLLTESKCSLQPWTVLLRMRPQTAKPSRGKQELGPQSSCPLLPAVPWRALVKSSARGEQGPQEAAQWLFWHIYEMFSPTDVPRRWETDKVSWRHSPEDYYLGEKSRAWQHWAAAQGKPHTAPAGGPLAWMSQHHPPRSDLTARASLSPSRSEHLALTCQRRKTTLCHCTYGKHKGRCWILIFWSANRPRILSVLLITPFPSLSLSLKSKVPA